MDGEENQGVIVSIRGSVIDARFPAGKVPAIGNVLKAGENGHVRIEVMAQLNAEVARGISLMPTQGLARGAAVIDTGSPTMVPVGKELLGRVFNVFGEVIDEGPPVEVKTKALSVTRTPLRYSSCMKPCAMMSSSVLP